MSKVRPTQTQRYIEKALRESGLPWRIELGKKHRKVFVNDRLMMVFSNGSTHSFSPEQIVARIEKARHAPAT